MAINWNIRIAWHIIQEEINGEIRYGIESTGADELQKLEAKGIDISHATIYMPASYGLLENLFDEIKRFKLHHFLDIGCGKGRAICVAAHQGFTEVTGIDFSEDLCKTATENICRIKNKLPNLSYHIINIDARYYKIPTEVDCIFLFNPFDETIMRVVVENIIISLQQLPRELYIIYINPLHKELFLNRGFTEVFYTKKLKYLEGSLLKKGFKSKTLGN